MHLDHTAATPAPHDPVLAAMADALRAAGWECTPPMGPGMGEYAHEYLQRRNVSVRLSYLPYYLLGKERTRVGDLVAFAENPRRIPNFGKITLEELRTVLRRDGLLDGEGLSTSGETTSPSKVRVSPDTLDMDRVRVWVFEVNRRHGADFVAGESLSDERLCEIIAALPYIDYRRAFLAFMQKGGGATIKAIAKQEGRSPQSIRQRIKRASLMVCNTAADEVEAAKASRASEGAGTAQPCVGSSRAQFQDGRALS